ncbi:hypothetical protein LM599_04450 [Candidatus Acetothermia bacterium]|nr:hypothetical protein [Candidatus Acetothermia bacterium]
MAGNTETRRLKMNAIHHPKVRQVFDQFSRACSAEAGALWGISLLAPVILVDRETREVVASHSGPEGQLSPEESLFVGHIPADLPIANTALDWAGMRWVMIVWQLLPDDPRDAVWLLAHEAFHWAQERLGFPSPNTTEINAHLDDLEGRYWIQLEWLALAKAVAASGVPRRRAVADALLFRHLRRALYPLAAVEERVMEMHEGLAEYTGVKLAGIAESDVAQETENGPTRFPSFMQSFAYISGPAYGLLLDAANEGWRAEVKSSNDLGCLLQNALKIEIPTDAHRAARLRARRYKGDELWQRELTRKEQQETQLAEYRARLVDGPVLVLPLAGGVRYSYDPRLVIPLKEAGTVFPVIRVIAPWGTLEMTEGGLLVDSGWETVRVPAPTVVSEEKVGGDGWKLHLASGWVVRRAEHPDHWRLFRIESAAGK